jgi:DNA-3-methyladenine glycosylase II
VNQTTFLLWPPPPFRLDLTVWALRRRPLNQIDRWDGVDYRRVLLVDDDPLEVSVTPSGKDGSSVRVSIEGERADQRVKELMKQAVANALGLRVDLSRFYRLARQDPKLAPLARKFRGMKPPRFYSAFEGLINGIACQQLSLSAGIQLLNRLAQSFGVAIRTRNSLNYAFPRPKDLAGLKPDTIRKLGFNFQKARAIVEISRAIVEGQLDLEGLRGVSDEDAMNRLTRLRGVGRWTAEYTLLRGMGRWHIFPVADQGARNGLARWLHLQKPLDAAYMQRLLRHWEPYSGLIYFHMLVKGLDEAGFLRARSGEVASLES